MDTEKQALEGEILKVFEELACRDGVTRIVELSNEKVWCMALGFFFQLFN